jgi:hypothetical protein
MTDCKLKGFPRINSKKIYEVTRDGGNLAAKKEKMCNGFGILHS